MSGIIKKAVLLLKAQKSEEPDKYESLLHQNGYKVFQAKTLDFRYSNLEELKRRLTEPQNYSGIIFSSPRCVHAVGQSLNDRQLDEGWHQNDNFAVGEATTDVALQTLGVRCKGGHTGNAENLAEYIIKAKENQSYTKPFLFPHGNLITGTLGMSLAEVNVGLEGVCVYETVANADLERELAEITVDYSAVPEYVVFFSPSGVQHALHLVRKVAANDVKFIAIGPVTEKKMLEESVAVFGVAERPKAEDVLKVINGS